MLLYLVLCLIPALANGFGSKSAITSRSINLSSYAGVSYSRDRAASAARLGMSIESDADTDTKKVLLISFVHTRAP